MKLDEIRNRFLKYFERNGHRIVSSSSLIPAGDPTLMFTNAGMNQFKDIFLGQEKRDYVRAVTSQKCFRASGKHNDLENVGVTARHHTFFEMLGNFSFGDYFKREAIPFAWEFLTEELGLPKDKLWVTIFDDDDEAMELWKEITDVDPERIVRMGEKDNFWSMGDTGPCGPCSEIHIDQGEGVGCQSPDCKLGCECDRFLELWNLVFMQYERDSSGKLNPLPRPSIDTGMGIERIAAVMQGVHSNYHTDLFRDLIGRICELADMQYGADPKTDVSLQVIADHARAMSFLIVDGILPSNEGRGYVLRRVMRRAGRHAKMLGLNEPVLFKIADKVVDLMGQAYPELEDRRSYIAEVVRMEEERFLLTLDTGLRILGEQTQKHQADGKPFTLPGEVAFKLYDTYGFPLDLTEVIGQEEGFVVDVEGFEKSMQQQRKRARAHWKGSGEEAVESIYKELRNQDISSEFVGYNNTSAKSEVLVILAGPERKTQAGPGDEIMLIAKHTPFYGESGGQIGDTGILRKDGFKADVSDTLRPLPDLIVHKCKVSQGSVSEGDIIELLVDQGLRADTQRNHSATHLLQAALREVLGDHVHQKGSLVTPERFRFDLTHFSAVSAEDLQNIERRVNELIRANDDVTVRQMPYREAIEKGAIALFDEKYGDDVRMVQMGEVSLELCGGTHTHRTGDIGLFKILSESSVAAGVRRIEALTGRAAYEYVLNEETLLKTIAEKLKSSDDQIIERIDKLHDEIKKLKKDIKSAAHKKGAGSIDLESKIRDKDGLKVLVARVEVSNPQDLRGLSDQARQKMKSGVAVLGTKTGDKALLLVAVTDDLKGKVHAGNIIKEVAPLLGGKGGGRPDFAQAGGPDADNLEQALEKAFELI